MLLSHHTGKSFSLPDFPGLRKQILLLKILHAASHPLVQLATVSSSIRGAVVQSRLARRSKFKGSGAAKLVLVRRMRDGGLGGGEKRENEKRKTKKDKKALLPLKYLGVLKGSRVSWEMSA